jgi:hypothetical protein
MEREQKRERGKEKREEDTLRKRARGNEGKRQ